MRAGKNVKHSTSSSPLLKACLRFMFEKFVNESDAKWIFLGSVKHFFLYNCQKCSKWSKSSFIFCLYFIVIWNDFHCWLLGEALFYVLSYKINKWLSSTSEGLLISFFFFGFCFPVLILMLEITSSGRHCIMLATRGRLISFSYFLNMEQKWMHKQ